MKKNFDFAYAAGVILLFIGWFLALLPHAFHAQAGLGEQAHGEHVFLGLASVVAGVGVLYWNSRKK